MDKGDNPLTSAGSLKPGIEQIIKAEVQAGMNAVDKSPSCASTPFLSAAPADDPDDMEEQQPSTHPSMIPWYWGQFVFSIAPLSILAMLLFKRTKGDPLAISILAFLVVLVLLWFYLVVCLFQIFPPTLLCL